MTEKKYLFLMTLLALNAPLYADQAALLYLDERALRSGDGVVGVQTGDSLIASLDQAPDAIYWGTLKGDLGHASLIAFDRAMRMAAYQPSGVVADVALQESHRRHVVKTIDFLPAGAAPSHTDKALIAKITPLDAPQDEDPLILRVNGIPTGSDKVSLKEVFGKSRFTLEVISASQQPLRHFSLALSSDPEAAFWRQGSRKNGSDVPEKVFRYNPRTHLSTLKRGESLTFPLEIHFIKKRLYVWTFDIVSEGRHYQKKILVEFN